MVSFINVAHIIDPSKKTKEGTQCLDDQRREAIRKDVWRNFSYDNYHPYLLTPLPIHHMILCSPTLWGLQLSAQMMWMATSCALQCAFHNLRKPTHTLLVSVSGCSSGAGFRQGSMCPPHFWSRRTAPRLCAWRR